jgi:chromosome segregation ATPase
VISLSPTLAAIDPRDLSGITALAALLSDPTRAAALTADIKAAHDEARGALAALVAKDADLSAREQALTERADAVDARESEVNGRLNSVTRKEAAFETWSKDQASKLSARRDELDKQAAELAGREAQLAGDVARLKTTLGG